MQAPQPVRGAVDKRADRQPAAQILLEIDLAAAAAPAADHRNRIIHLLAHEIAAVERGNLVVRGRRGGQRPIEGGKVSICNRLVVAGRLLKPARRQRRRISVTRPQVGVVTRRQGSREILQQAEFVIIRRLQEETFVPSGKRFGGPRAGSLPGRVGQPGRRLRRAWRQQVRGRQRTGHRGRLSHGRLVRQKARPSGNRQWDLLGAPATAEKPKIPASEMNKALRISVI